MSQININKIDIMKLSKKKDEICKFILDNKDRFYEPYLYVNLIQSGRIIYTPLDFDTLQLLSKFDVLEIDFYRKFLQMLKKYKLLNTNCIEVASGICPVLAEYAAPIINKNGKTLTIYDPRLTFENIDGVIAKSELFTRETDISNIDTLYGIFTCDATEIIVERAIEEDKNLLVALCDCDHPSIKYPKKENEYWANTFCECIKKEYKDEFDILSWPKEYEFDIPIIVRMTKKQNSLILNRK